MRRTEIDGVEVSVHRYSSEDGEDIDGHEVTIDGEGDLNLSVKVGTDAQDNEGQSIAIVDVHEDGEFDADEPSKGSVEKGGSGSDYAYFRLIEGEE